MSTRKIVYVDELLDACEKSWSTDEDERGTFYTIERLPELITELAHDPPEDVRWKALREWLSTPDGEYCGKPTGPVTVSRSSEEAVLKQMWRIENPECAEYMDSLTTTGELDQASKGDSNDT